MSYKFKVEPFFPRRIMDAITEARVNRPEIIEVAADRRKRRPRPTQDGKLIMIACDHAARGLTGTLDKPLLMGNRQEYMGRVLRAILHPELDGVMAQTDMIEDLLILDYLVQERGGPSLLDNRVIAGCMNRGGVFNVSGELHDRFTSFTADSLVRLHLDGGKMLLRVNNDDERTLMTLGESALAVTALARQNLLAFVEPLPTKGILGAYTPNHTVEELVKWIGVCAALGETSRNTWLKVPYIPHFEQVALATTLPLLLLGGPARPDPLLTLTDFSAGMSSGSNVRGAMVGRNVIFPGDDDPLAMTVAITAVIRNGAPPHTAVEMMAGVRDSKMDGLTQYFKN